MGCLVSALASADVTPLSHEGEIVGGKFRLERVLGEGGMGVVYAAVHLDLVKHVAIKIIRDEYATREDVVERMLNEARSAAKLRSEHVAHVLDVGQLDNGAPYIVMDYLDGCDLAAHLADGGRLPAAEAVLYVMQACEAVAEAHALGIIHRDLKPENLFLSSRADGEPLVKVLDFGISKPANDPTSTGPGLVIGSPDYMSPEAVRGEAPTTATDIWSLGAVLYELITGTRPFDAHTVKDTWQRILNDQQSSPRAFAPALHDDLEAVMARCLAKNAADRYASVADLAAALSPFGPEGSADLAKRVARVASSVRWQPRGTLSNAPRVRLDNLPPERRSEISGINRRDSAPAPSITAPAQASTSIAPPKRSRAMAWLALASTLAAATLGLLLIRNNSDGKRTNVENAVVSGRIDAAMAEASTVPPVTAATEKVVPATATSEQKADAARAPNKEPARKTSTGKRRTDHKAKSAVDGASPEVPEAPAAGADAPGDPAAPSQPVATPGADEPAAPPVAPPAAPADADPYDSTTFGGRK